MTFDSTLREINEAQTKAFVAVNRELIATYWDIGKTIHEKLLTEKIAL